MVGRRLQILLDEGRHARLAAAADRRGVPVAVIVLEAIDQALAPRERERAAAARAIVEAAPMGVPSPEELRAELEDVRSRRG